MSEAMLLTGSVLVYAASGIQPSVVPRPLQAPWLRSVGLVLLTCGTCLAAVQQGMGPGIASALVIIMAAISLLALLVPLAPRAGWGLAGAVTVGPWLHVLWSLA